MSERLLDKLAQHLQRLADAVHGIWVIDACGDQDIDGFTEEEIESARARLSFAEMDAREVLIDYKRLLRAEAAQRTPEPLAATPESGSESGSVADSRGAVAAPGQDEA